MIISDSARLSPIISVGMVWNWPSHWATSDKMSHRLPNLRRLSDYIEMLQL